MSLESHVVTSAAGNFNWSMFGASFMLGGIFCLMIVALSVYWSRKHKTDEQQNVKPLLTFGVYTLAGEQVAYVVGDEIDGDERNTVVYRAGELVANIPMPHVMVIRAGQVQ